eukprot:scaffold55490_cov61-Cyclotella_meneghiniana.AAC.10
MFDPLILSQIRVMQQQERSSSYRCLDYLSNTQVKISPSVRLALCDWAYKTIVVCDGVDRSTAIMAFSYFDRFLSSNAPAAKRALNDLQECQLAFVTSLVIALKCHSGFKVEYDFVSKVVTGDAYDEEELSYMEMEVLQALDWKLNGPSSDDFIGYFLELLSDAHGAPLLHFVRSFSKSLVQLAVTRYDVVVQHNPSEIAFASIWCAFQCAELVFPDSQLFLESMMVIKLVSKFDINDARSKSLIKLLKSSVEEFYSASDGIEDTQSQEDEMASVSSDSSPRSITRDV